MDAYIPLPATATTYLPVSCNDQPWDMVSGTQTLIWRRTSVAPRADRFSSLREQQAPTFFILNVPQIEGLERLRTFRDWQDNWDAEGGKAPDKDTIDTATAVFGVLSVHRAPQVTLSAEGHPMFIFGAPFNGEVVVTSPNTIDYFFADETAPEGEDVELNGVPVPQELLDYLRIA